MAYSLPELHYFTAPIPQEGFSWARIARLTTARYGRVSERSSLVNPVSRSKQLATVGCHYVWRSWALTDTQRLQTKNLMKSWPVLVKRTQGSSHYAFSSDYDVGRAPHSGSVALDGELRRQGISVQRERSGPY
jgi:hypothetical protein